MGRRQAVVPRWPPARRPAPRGAPPACTVWGCEKGSVLRCPYGHGLCEDCATASTRVAIEERQYPVPCQAPGCLEHFRDSDLVCTSVGFPLATLSSLEDLRMEAAQRAAAGEGDEVRRCPVCPYFEVHDAGTSSSTAGEP